MLEHQEQQYLNLLKKLLECGKEKNDRTGIGTYSVFGEQIRFDLTKGFPLLTTKKLHFKSIAIELLWFLKGETNIQFLKDNNVKIWHDWADKGGNLGPVYGKQWRKWEADGKKYDQIAMLIDSIKTNPNSRRHIVSAWNVADLTAMKLPPCHLLFQFYVQDDKLSCHLYMRSTDVFLGLPFNIASYALLLTMIAQVTNLTPHELIISFGDLHLYQNHVEQAKVQIERVHKAFPKLTLDPNIKDIDHFEYKHFTIHDYDPLPHIKADIAV